LAWLARFVDQLVQPVGWPSLAPAKSAHGRPRQWPGEAPTALWIRSTTQRRAARSFPFSPLATMVATTVARLLRPSPMAPAAAARWFRRAATRSSWWSAPIGFVRPTVAVPSPPCRLGFRHPPTPGARWCCCPPPWSSPFASPAGWRQHATPAASSPLHRASVVPWEFALAAPLQ
jgi:hypothetical protein